MTMAKENEGLRAVQTLMPLTFVGIAMANYASAQWLGYPFLYCTFAPISRTLYTALGTMILYGCCAYIAYSVLTKNAKQALLGVCLFVAVVELPVVADLAFRLGRSCHG
jgi:cell division protein FtsW (lipid II flippase)